jgi:hypothetical protein
VEQETVAKIKPPKEAAEEPAVKEENK